MAFNITEGTITTATATGTIKRDVSDEVFFLNAETSPLIAFLKKLKKKEKCHAPKFEWYDKELGTPLLTVNGATLATATSIVIDAGQAATVQAGTVLYAPATGEQILVTAVTPSTGTLTVTRGWGTTAAADIADNATLVVLSTVHSEGTTSPEGIALASTAYYNYTYIQKHAVELTRTELGTDRYDEKNPKLVEKRKELWIMHQEALERQFIFGQLKEDLTGAPKRNTRGVLSSIVTNVTDCGGTFTRTKMNTFLQSVFKYRKGNKVLFVGADLLDAIDANILSTANVTITPSSKEFGLDVTSWISPYGKINIVYHRVLSEVFPKYGLCVDLDLATYMFIDDTTLKMNVQTNDYDGVKDMYITEAGLRLRGEKAHGLIKL